MIIFLFFLALCLFAWMVFIYLNIFYTVFLKVPMLSTDSDVVRKVADNIELAKGKKFYDLGSGNGRFISQLAKSRDDLEYIGIEYNVGAYFRARIRNIFSPKKIFYRKGDFFKMDIKDADVVYTYLFPGIMARLENKFSQELKKGTLVIANTFPLKSRQPKKILPAERGTLGTLYIYEY
jgi:SAM-dependent methyltransferase